MPRHGLQQPILWQSVFRPAQASFKPFSQSGQILCRFRLALRRKSGPRIALPAHRLYYPVDMWHRSTTRGFVATCEVFRDHTARAHAATAVLSDCFRFCLCGLVLCGSSAPPSRQRATWLSACRRRAKRPSSSTRQANEVGRMSRRASRI